MKKGLFKLLFFFYSPFILIYWFVFRPKSVGVKCVVRNAEKVALIKTSYGKKLWTLPGGDVKRGESLEEAIIREVREEMGIEIINLKKHGSIY